MKITAFPNSTISFVLMLSFVDVVAFEVDGFVSGEPMTVTLSKAGAMGHNFLPLSEQSNNTISYYLDSATTIALGFCNGILVNYRRAIGKSLESFVRTVEKEGLKYGQATDYRTESYDV